MAFIGGASYNRNVALAIGIGAGLRKGATLRLFYFILKAGHRSIPDNDGVELPNETAAGRHALLVARELMRNRERRTFRWQIQVCDDYMLPLFSVLFFEADESF